MVKVAVKWNKRVFEDVEVAASVVDFKTKLQELTVSNVAYTDQGEREPSKHMPVQR